MTLPSWAPPWILTGLTAILAYITGEHPLSTPSPVTTTVPYPAATTWAQALADLEAAAKTAFIAPIVAFEVGLTGETDAQIVEAAAALPAQLAANGIAMAAPVAQAVLAVATAKAIAALTPKTTAAPAPTPTPAAPATPAT